MIRLPLFTFVVLVSVGFAQDKKDAITLTENEKAILDNTNAERKKAGLAELQPNARLLDAARSHAANMARQDKLDHTLDGKSSGDRVKAAGYLFRRAGENIAHNQRSAAEVVGSWMQSPGHRSNMLHADYTEIGIAVAKNAKGESYWIQVFGAPLR